RDVILAHRGMDMQGGVLTHHQRGHGADDIAHPISGLHNVIIDCPATQVANHKSTFQHDEQLPTPCRSVSKTHHHSGTPLLASPRAAPQPPTGTHAHAHS